MATEVVRLGPASLAEMSRRLNSRLTDEGAKAWYAHDVAELLQEIMLLRQERARAFDGFQEHLQDQYDDSVPLSYVAERWRETATGIWEKAHIRKIRAETAEARQERDALQHAVANMTATLEETERKYEEQKAARSEQIRALAARNEALSKSLAEHVDQLATLGQELLLARQELKEAQTDCGRKIMAAEVEASSWKAEVRALLGQLSEIAS